MVTAVVMIGKKIPMAFGIKKNNFRGLLFFVKMRRGNNMNSIKMIDLTVAMRIFVEK